MVMSLRRGLRGGGVGAFLGSRGSKRALGSECSDSITKVRPVTTLGFRSFRGRRRLAMGSVLHVVWLGQRPCVTQEKLKATDGQRTWPPPDLPTTVRGQNCLGQKSSKPPD